MTFSLTVSFPETFQTAILLFFAFAAFYSERAVRCPAIKYTLLSFLFALAESAIIRWLAPVSLFIDFLFTLVFFCFVIPALLRVSLSAAAGFFCLQFVLKFMINAVFSYLILPVFFSDMVVSRDFVYLSNVYMTVFSSWSALILWKQVLCRFLSDIDGTVLLLPAVCLLFAQAYLFERPYFIEENIRFWLSAAGIFILSCTETAVILQIHLTSRDPSWPQEVRRHARHLSREYQELSDQYAHLRRQEHDIHNQLTTLKILVRDGHLEEARSLAETLRQKLEDLSLQAHNEDSRSP